MAAIGDFSSELDLSPDELLSTTRSVRRRLDLTRPVDLTLIEQCFDLAQQAPSGGNLQGWSFVVVIRLLATEARPSPAMNRPMSHA